MTRRWVIGIDEVGRGALKRRAPRLARCESERAPRHSFVIGIDEVGRAVRKRTSLARQSYVIGIDEVGRGALAGPVVVAAVALPANRKSQIANRALGKLRDSKKLSASQRAAWFKYLKQHPGLLYKISRVYPRGIERLNIARAANRAASRALLRLATSHRGLATRAKIYLDGGLFLDKKNLMAIGYTLNPKTVVRGDEKITAIKIASIIAKVSRDEYMKKLSKKYSQYGFEIHKGYGTKVHRARIKKYGPILMHRLTFLKKYSNIISNL